jgi:N-acetylglucosaminyldiphosphoundecaprenol N-acetyl-beta-D-mannosaminyltransferase
MSDRFGFEIADVLGVPVHAATMAQVLDAIQSAIAERRRLQLGVVNAAKIVNMTKDASLREDVLSSDLVLADGMSVVVASRLLGQPLPERIAGIDLMMAILERGNRLGWRVFCLGATEEVSEAVARRIGELYPGVVIAGRRNGYFTETEEPEVARMIADSNADVLFVAITSPKKEKFMAAWGASLNTPIIHGVGGSFDVLAGKVQRAPERWQRLGLEWLYRVKQEPGRLWKRYLFTNASFARMLLVAWFGRLLGKEPT